VAIGLDLDATADTNEITNLLTDKTAE